MLRRKILMDNLRMVSVVGGILVAFLVSGGIVASRAQAEVQLDEAEAAIASLVEMEPLAPEAIPRTGTFYVLSDRAMWAGRLLAPLPCPPKEGVVYQASRYRADVFLVDGRPEPRVDGELLSALVSLRIQLAAATPISTSTGAAALESSGSLDSQVEGDSGGGLLGYGTNDLWFTIGVSNWGAGALASFTIYPPDVNTRWDLFGTTNLALNGWLNLTNWAWILRTEIGETNAALTNLWPGMGFFRLGTMLDSDGDELTDAYEQLTSHSHPGLWDTDGDGLSDGWEVANGLDPTLDDSTQAGSRANYVYDAGGWLWQVMGARSEWLALDDEGNVRTAQ
jgi:hypothetical protein